MQAVVGVQDTVLVSQPPLTLTSTKVELLPAALPAKECVEHFKGVTLDTQR